MEVTVGREQQSRRLNVIRDGKTQFVGNPGSVPMDVSRQHVSLCLKEKNKWEIKNLNDKNVTYVNGVAIEKKLISESDKIELGTSRYALSWDIIRGPKQETADIRHLRQVWDEYKEGLREIEDRQKNTMLLSSIPMTFSMIGSVITGLTGYRDLMIVFAIIAVTLLIYSLLRRKNDTSRDDKEELTKSMYKRYVCPKCGKFLGMQDYDLLIQQMDQCTYCKAKFIK